MPAAFAPGRVNLIGEHTDYNDGLALPFAVAEGITVRAQARDDGRIVVRARDLEEADAFPAADPPPGDGWRAFVRGAVAELRRAGVVLAGAELEFGGTVARGGGLSSSAALEVALVLALRALAGAPPDPDRIELARLCSRIENDWVGAQTGLLDQLASLCGRADSALRIDFRDLTVEPIPLRLQGHRIVALDSGEAHDLSGSGYNDRRRECAAAGERLGLTSLRDATLAMADRLPAPLDRRVRHVVTENERVHQTVAALEAGDLPAVGELLAPRTPACATTMRSRPLRSRRRSAALREAGALGARIVGGGFGGTVIGLLPPDACAPDGAEECPPARARGCSIPAGRVATMSADALRAAEEKMRADGQPAEAIAAFRSAYQRLEDGEQATIPSDELEPARDVPALDELPAAGDPALLDRFALVKLNGGLATSMGLEQPKSLLEAKEGRTFLEIIAGQVLVLRERHGIRLPLVLMDSEATQAATLAALRQHDELAVEGLALDFRQSMIPKLERDTLAPVRWPAAPALEWCPPGHGDVYGSLRSSGMLGALLERGFHYAMISNADNLGSVFDPRIAEHLAAQRDPIPDGGGGGHRGRPQGRPHRPPAGRRAARPARDRADAAGGRGVLP